MTGRGPGADHEDVTVRRDPQREKALDYAHDRRNDYGENDKSSRKNIRRNKRFPHRAERRRARQTLTGADGVAVPGLAEDIEQRLGRGGSNYARRRRKYADVALGDWVVGRLRRRAVAGMDDPATTEARIDRISRTRQSLKRPERAP
jgi:hypothetical protein